MATNLLTKQYFSERMNQALRPSDIESGSFFAAMEVHQATRPSIALWKSFLATFRQVNYGEAGIDAFQRTHYELSLEGLSPLWLARAVTHIRSGLRIDLVASEFEPLPTVKTIGRSPEDLPRLISPMRMDILYSDIGLAAIGQYDVTQRLDIIPSDIGKWRSVVPVRIPEMTQSD